MNWDSTEKHAGSSMGWSETRYSADLMKNTRQNLILLV